MKIELNEASIIRYFKIIAFMAILIGMKIFGEMLYSGRSLILPLALAVFLSYMIGPIIDWMVNRRFPKWLAVTLAITGTGLLFFFLGVIIKTNIDSFVIEFPRYEARTYALIENVFTFLNIDLNSIKSTPSSLIQDPRLSQFFEDLSLTKIITNLLGSISNLLSNIFLVLLFLMFMLAGRNTLNAKIKIAFNSNTADRISNIFININDQIQKYIVAKTLISLLTAILVMIVLFSFGIKFALVWGILTLLLNFIPNVGSILSTVLPLSIAIIQFDSLTPVFWLAVILFSIQVIIGNVLDPRYVGKKINLSAIVVLFALIFWGWLWGIIGMFLSIPIMVIIKIVLENIPELKFLAVLMSSDTDEELAQVSKHD